MADRTLLVTGASAGIGRATALSLARMRCGPGDPWPDPESTKDAAGELSAAGGGPVEVFAARPVRPVGGAAGGRRGPPAPSADRGAGQQRRGVLEHPPRHRRRARAHLRPQPSGAVPAHHPAPRPIEAQRPGAGGHRLLQRPGPAGAVVFRGTGLQPVQAGQRPVHLRAGPQDPSQLGHRQCAASRPDPNIVQRRGSGRSPAAAGSVAAAVHESPGPGRRDLDPPGLGARAGAGDGPLLR
jgi:hypothetical protein